MATVNSKFRFVRCPKCSKILMEIDEVPLYQCGGCGLTIQAKKHSSIDANLHRGSTKVGFPDTSRNDKGDLSGSKENEIAKRFESTKYIQFDANIPTHELSGEGSDGIRIQHKAEIESNSDNSSLRSSTRSSQAYDGSGSSPDDIAGSKPPKNYKLLSRRTFRNTKVTNSVSDKANDEVDDHTDHIKQRSLSLSKERQSSISSERFYSKVNIYNPESSFNSSSYRSSQNWMDYKEAPLSSLSRNPVFEDLVPSEYHGIERRELLKKVEELMHQVSSLSVDRLDSKRKSQYVRSYPQWGSDNSFRMFCHHSPAHHKDLDVETSRSKNKRFASKRHCLPIIGGAPFIICNKCFQLLQLPVDFLATRRKLQKIKCGTCSKVNVYPSQNNTANLTNAQGGTEVLPDKSDPVSYSDEYGVCSSNNSSAVTEQPSSLALHKLFGYSSARELLQQPSNADDAYQSIWKDLRLSHGSQDGSHANE